jgi:predicted DNA-binding protein
MGAKRYPRVLSVRVPAGCAQTLEAVRRKLGLRSWGEVVRLAIERLIAEVGGPANMGG